MKKIISLLVTAALLCTVIALAASPALAELTTSNVPMNLSGELTGERTATHGVCVVGDTVVKKGAEITFDNSLIVSKNTTMTVESGAVVAVNRNFTIKSGGALVIGGCFAGELPDHTIDGTITLLPGANVDVKFKFQSDAENFAAALEDYGAKIEDVIGYERYHVRVTCSVPADNMFLNSTISDGSMALIVGVACLAIGFLAGMLVFRKKPTPAEAENETDAESDTETKAE